MAQRSIKATMTNGSRNRFNDTLTKATLKFLFWQKNGLESVPTGVIFAGDKFADKAAHLNNVEELVIT